MSFWSNLIGYQLTWLLAVASAAHGHPWLAVAAAAVFVSWQLFAARHRSVELRLLVLALLLGIVVDGVLAGSGWASYASPQPAVPAHGAPVWILALWACFAMTLNRSLQILRGRPWLAATFGALGAPLAYLAAARGWQAMQFPADAWRAWLWLALGWAVALALLATLATRWQPDDAATATMHARTP